MGGIASGDAVLADSSTALRFGRNDSGWLVMTIVVVKTPCVCRGLSELESLRDGV